MKRLLIIFIFFFFTFPGYPQELVTFSNQQLGRKLCEVYGRSFISETEANDAINKILSTIGASKRFVVQSCNNIPNALAVTIRGIRYIYYNKKFINDINSATNYWSNISILAHEVGHHINGHTTDALLAFGAESLYESRKMELEADEFSGFVLAKLGATLTQATQAIALTSSDEDDNYSTHPSKTKRINAIKKGYNKSKTNVISYEKTTSQIANEYFYIAYKKFELGDTRGAMEDWSKAIEIKPDFALAYCYIGWALINNDIEEEIEESGLNLSLNDIESIKNDSYRLALENGNKAIEIKPDLAMGYMIKGLAKRRLEDYSGALDDYSKAIELDPKFADAYNNRGNIRMDLEDYSKAIIDYTKAIELDSNSNDIDVWYNTRGTAKRLLNDYNGAIEDYSKAIEIKPYPFRFYNRGLSKTRLEDYSGAIDDYTKAIEMDSKLVSAYINRGWVKGLLENYISAIEDFDKAIELDASNGNTYDNRARVKQKLNDIPGACKDWEMAFNLGNESAGLFLLAFCGLGGN